ncbi:MAG TPA: Wzz/FepE/Etk N-terminal domain-containing protein [Candidatus Binataceae bacterium]|nr:Wzz/FepE/Etk N-terminal domain-containing protein [Candidatus Binataceae bacterium]
METINLFPRQPESSGARNLGNGAQLSPGSHLHATIELLKYFKLLYRHAWLIIGVTLAAMTLNVLYNELLATRLYQAQAVITPVPPDQDMSQIGGGGLGDMLGGGGGLASMLMGTSDNELVSERDMAILNSFDFTTNLVKRYGLVKYLLAGQGEDPGKLTPWRTYLLINGGFNADYDYKTGNLNLSFVDSSRARAQQVLTWYLEALRERLRSQEVQSAASAAKSLEDEISHTSDSLLQSQLYELLARQIQREKLAQVQADFAFKVIEPPVVPDARFSPRVTRSGIMTGFVVFVLMCLGVVVREWVKHAHAHLNALNASISPLVDAVEHDEIRPREPAPITAEKIRLRH